MIQRVIPMPTARQMQCNPPFAGAYRFGVGVDRCSAGDHRLGQMLSAQAIEDDRADMEDDQAENDVEPQFVKVAGLVGRVGTDQPVERTGVESVFILGDQPEPDLDSDRSEQGDDAQSAERLMADAGPLTPPDSGRAALVRARSWRTAPSSFRRSPTRGGK